MKAAWLAISSCVFAEVRTSLSTRDIESVFLNPKPTQIEDEGSQFDKHYFRAMTDGGAALDEFIEMRNLMKDPPGEEYD